MKVPETEAERFEFELWPQSSKFVSWKVSFRREAISGSTHPRLISDWSAEIDLAIRIEVLDHLGFIFDKHQIEFETLDSQIARGIMKTLPAKFWRKINFSEETQFKNGRSMLTGRQIMFQIFSFINIKKTPGISLQRAGSQGKRPKLPPRSVDASPHANSRGDRAAQYKHARQVHLKERASPYDHSTQRKTPRDHSDRARNT